MHDLTVESFSAHLNETFTVIYQTTPFELVLVEASARPGGRPGGRAPFALLFHGPLTPVLPQAMHRFEHPAFSALDLFIVPVGPDDGHMRYEAIFS